VNARSRVSFSLASRSASSSGTPTFHEPSTPAVPPCRSDNVRGDHHQRGPVARRRSGCSPAGAATVTSYASSRDHWEGVYRSSATRRVTPASRTPAAAAHRGHVEGVDRDHRYPGRRRSRFGSSSITALAGSALEVASGRTVVARAGAVSWYAARARAAAYQIGSGRGIVRSRTSTVARNRYLSTRNRYFPSARTGSRLRSPR
jgi:hypothetical protein